MNQIFRQVFVNYENGWIFDRKRNAFVSSACAPPPDRPALVEYAFRSAQPVVNFAVEPTQANLTQPRRMPTTRPNRSTRDCHTPVSCRASGMAQSQVAVADLLATWQQNPKRTSGKRLHDVKQQCYSMSDDATQTCGIGQ